MLRNKFSQIGLILLAGAVFFATPDSVWAQHGGGHFGGGHFGGAHFGGYHGGFYHSGYHPHYSGSYILPPYYDGSGSYSDYTYPDTGAGLNLNYASDFYNLYGSGTPSYSAGYQSWYPPVTSPTQPDLMAHVTVEVPTDARVWFDGKATTSTGVSREYDSPPLTPGHRYSYAIKASWKEHGQEVTQTQQVDVTAGAQITVRFPAPPKSAAGNS